MRKALELKEDELKAFFIKVSARQKQQRSKGPQPLSTQAGPCLLRSSGGEHSGWDVDTGGRLRGQLAPGEGLNLPAVIPWPFSVLASQIRWAWAEIK